MVPACRPLAIKVSPPRFPITGDCTHVPGNSCLLFANDCHVRLDADRTVDPCRAPSDARRVGTGDDRERQAEGSSVEGNADRSRYAVRTVDHPTERFFQCFAFGGQEQVISGRHCPVRCCFDTLIVQSHPIGAVNADFFDQQGSWRVVHDNDVERKISAIFLIEGAGVEDKGDVWLVCTHLGAVLDPDLSTKQCCETGGYRGNRGLQIHPDHSASVRRPKPARKAGALNTFSRIPIVLGWLLQSGMKLPGGAGYIARRRQPDTGGGGLSPVRSSPAISKVKTQA